MIDQRPLRYKAHEKLARLRSQHATGPAAGFLFRSLFHEPCIPSASTGTEGNEWKLTTDWYHCIWHPDISAEEISEFETPPAWYMTPGIRKTKARWQWFNIGFAMVWVSLFWLVPQIRSAWSIAVALLLGTCLWAIGEYRVIQAMRADARAWVSQRSGLLDKVVTMDEIGSEHQKDLLFAAIHGSTYANRQAAWTIAVSLRSLRPLEESWLRYSDLIEATYLHSAPARKLQAHLDDVEGQMMELWSTIRNSLAALSTNSPNHGQPA